MLEASVKKAPLLDIINISQKKIIIIRAGELSKGMSGKVATIGGCREYTGAPYFASMTCLRVGVLYLLMLQRLCNSACI